MYLNVRLILTRFTYLRLVPINDKQNTTISADSFSRGVLVKSQTVTLSFNATKSNE